MVSLNCRTFMEDSAVPSNLSLPKVPELDGAATSARAKNEKGPKPGEHIPLFCMKRRPSSHFALNGLGVLCLRMCYRRFTIWSRTPNGVTVFFKDKIVRWTPGGGGVPTLH